MSGALQGKKRCETGKTEETCRNRSAVSDKTENFRKKFQISRENIRELSPANRYNASVTDKTAANFLKEVYRMENNMEILSPGYEGIIWNLDKFGTLTVTGKGKIPDCACGKRPDAPWENVKDQIREIEIGEGITEIGINALRECIHLKQVSIPDSLQRIHAYAFWNCTELTDIYSGSRNFTYIYDRSGEEKENTVIFGVEAFHNVPWPESIWGDFYCRDGVLYVCFSGKYHVVLVKDSSMGKFRRLKVLEKKRTDQEQDTVIEDKHIDVGESLYRRIRGGKVILCITYADNRICSVKSFAWNSRCGLPEEYLMYPVRLENGEVGAWRDSFTYQEKEDIVSAFENRDGGELEKEGVLRLCGPDKLEEWFWYGSKEDFGCGLEMDLLRLWLKKHQDIAVDSIEENRENDKIRLFVDV